MCAAVVQIGATTAGERAQVLAQGQSFITAPSLPMALPHYTPSTPLERPLLYSAPTKHFRRWTGTTERHSGAQALVPCQLTPLVKIKQCIPIYLAEPSSAMTWLPLPSVPSHNLVQSKKN